MCWDSCEGNITLASKSNSVSTANTNVLTSNVWISLKTHEYLDFLGALHTLKEYKDSWLFANFKQWKYPILYRGMVNTCCFAFLFVCLFVRLFCFLVWHRATQHFKITDFKITDYRKYITFAL